MRGLAAADGSGPGDAFRPDLEGLRGLAILLVLLFHAGIPGIPGGFVGVDVFFVLSGFLITGLLIREREGTGGVNLTAFYARRARRILPAALVVIVATLLVAAAVLPPLDVLRTADDAIAVALSVGNIRFAASAIDYFNGTTSPSPFLHYWSLGVEEQFYLLWPAILIVATRFGRPRLAAGIVLVAIVAASLGLAIWLTGVAAPWAFYSLPSRAWQLGLGGLLAIAAAGTGTRRLPVIGVVAAVVGWAGLAGVVAAAVVIDSGTPYPGVAALLPAGGAALVIATGSARFGPAHLLAVAPMRFLGRISYSLYLVHWPILVLPAAGLTLDEELPIGVRVGLALASVVIGSVCWRLVEQPIHRTVRFRAHPWRTMAASGAAISVTVAAVLAVSAQTSQSLDSALTAAPLESPAPGPTEPPRATPTSAALAGATVTPSVTFLISLPPVPPATSAPGSVVPGNLASALAAPTTTPAETAPAPPASAEPTPAPADSPPVATPAATATRAPAATPAPDPTTEVTPRPRPVPNPGDAQPLPANVRPPLRLAAGDRERIEADGCELGNFDVQPRSCVYGDPGGSVTVALVGDSHAAQWFPAVEAIARRHAWRLVVFTKISCRFTDLRIYSRDLKREYTECEQWREAVVERLQALNPDLVIVSAARGMATVTPADDNPARQGEGMARLLARVPGRHAIIVDTPQSRVEVPACLSSHVNDTRPCDTPRAVGLNWRHRLLEEAAANADGASLIDMTDVLCPNGTCPAVLDGYIMFRDVFHLTATFAASLADELEPALVHALRR